MPFLPALAPGLAAAALAVSATPAAAAVITTFTDRAVFDAATASFTLTDETFDTTALGPLPTTTPGTGVALSSSDADAEIDAAVYASGRSIQFSTDPLGSSVTFGFTSPVNAFGIDLFDAGTFGSTDVIVITAAGAEIVYDDLVAGRGNQAFLGLTSEDTISAVRVTNTRFGDVIELDDLVYGVPEPTSLALLATGGLTLTRRRRRSA